MATDSAEDSAQGPVEDAAKQAADTEPYSLRLRDRVLGRESSKKDDDKFPLLVIFVGIVVAAPIMLVGLPLATLWIVQQTGCCANASVASVENFWGSLITGMLALFGTLVAAVFIITSFRIDKSAKAEAESAAVSTVSDFLDRYRCELFAEIDRWAKGVESLRDTATVRISAAREAAETQSEAAVKRIAAVREDVDTRGQQTTETMEQAARDVAEARVSAIRRIGAEAEEVERVAAEVTARIRARQPGETPPSGSQD